MTEHARVDSWKGIADYLGRDVRTVIRWEKERGLPVHRVPGGRTRTVYAWTSELDAWMASGAHDEDGDAAPAAAPVVSPAPREGGIRRPRATPVALAVLVTLAAGAAAWLAAGARAVPADLVPDGSDLVARDAAGRPLWRYGIDGHQIAVKPANVHIGDLDGAPGPEVVAALEHVTPRGAYASSIYAFSARGGLRWQVNPSHVYTFGAGRFSGPWLPLDLLVAGAGADARIAAALHHVTWWPSMVAFYDTQGAAQGAFVNAGWISGLAVSRDGSRVLAAGLSNSRAAVILAVLDAARPSGHSPEDDGSPFACLDCPAGRPLKYFVFPYAEVRRLESRGAPLPQLRPLADGGYEVRALQHGATDRSDEMIYELDEALTLRRQAPSDSYWTEHARLEREGRLDHARAACPEPNGPPARVWQDGAWHDAAGSPSTRQRVVQQQGEAP